MSKNQTMTPIEYAAYRRLNKAGTLVYTQTTEHEKRALTRLVEKGLALEAKGGWAGKKEG